MTVDECLGPETLMGRVKVVVLVLDPAAGEWVRPAAEVRMPVRVWRLRGNEITIKPLSVFQ